MSVEEAISELEFVMKLYEKYNGMSPKTIEAIRVLIEKAKE